MLNSSVLLLNITSLQIRHSHVTSMFPFVLQLFHKCIHTQIHKYTHKYTNLHILTQAITKGNMVKQRVLNLIKSLRVPI